MTCVLDWCEEDADAGKWCRAHWDEAFARDVEIEMQSRSSESAAREIVTLRRRLDFLAARADVARSHCRHCGHALVIHSYGGCHGLKPNGSDEDGTDWTACQCQRFDGR